MARIKYDVRGVEGKRTVVPAGVYNLKVVGAEVTTPENKDERIELIAEVVGDKDHKGGKFYEYISVVQGSPQSWKLREFLEAVGQIKNGKGEAGTLDTSKLLGKVFGAKTYVRAADDARGFDEQNRIRKMFAIDGKASVEEDLDADEAEDDGNEYEDMTLPDLKAELNERGLSTRGKRAVLVARLLEDDEQEDEDEPEAEGDYTWDDLVELDRAGLRQMNKDEELGVKFTKTKDDDTLRAEVAGALDIDVPEEEEEEQEAEQEDDYDEWDDDDLREELSQRSLATKGSKKLLVRRLRADDAEEEKPF